MASAAGRLLQPIAVSKWRSSRHVEVSLCRVDCHGGDRLCGLSGRGVAVAINPGIDASEQHSGVRIAVRIAVRRVVDEAAGLADVALGGLGLGHRGQQYPSAVEYDRPPPGEQLNTTNRQRIEALTGKGTCGQACHATLINPLGYAFENYDSVGKYRTTDGGLNVEAIAAFQSGCASSPATM